MAKMILDDELMASLSNIATDDYQHGANYSGEPISIRLKQSDNLFNLQFFFKNTDEDIAEEWVNDFLTDYGLQKSDYELFSMSGEDTFVTASFALTEDGRIEDYIYTDEEKSLIKPLEQPIAVQNDSIASMLLNTNTQMTNQKGSKMGTSNKTKQNTVKKVTRQSATVASVIASMGQSLNGKSARVSTLDANGNKVSAAKQVQAFIDRALPNITAKEMSILTDTDQCKKMASLGFPLFMEVNPNLTYKDQATFLGKYRYGKTITTILGKNYYTTNHIFPRNIKKVEDMLTALKLINQPVTNVQQNISVQDSSTQDIATQNTNETVENNQSEIDSSQTQNIQSSNDILSIDTMSENEFVANMESINNVSEDNIQNVERMDQVNGSVPEIDYSRMNNEDLIKLLDQRVDSLKEQDSIVANISLDNFENEQTIEMDVDEM